MHETKTIFGDIANGVAMTVIVVSCVLGGMYLERAHQAPGVRIITEFRDMMGQADTQRLLASGALGTLLAPTPTNEKEVK